MTKTLKTSLTISIIIHIVLLSIITIPTVNIKNLDKLGMENSELDFIDVEVRAKRMK